MKSVSTHQFIVRVQRFMATTLIVSGCLSAIARESAAQTSQQQNPLPPTTWRSASTESVSTVSKSRTSEASRPALNATPLIVRTSTQQKSAPTPPTSSLASDLQREKEIRMQKISQRLQQLLNAGPGCGPDNGPGEQTESPPLFPSGITPFLPPIPSNPDHLPPNVRTMPEPSNSGGMKDESGANEQVPRPPDDLPVLPSPSVTKPLVNEAAKPSSGDSLQPETSQSTNPSMHNSQNSTETGDETSSNTNSANSSLSNTAENSQSAPPPANATQTNATPEVQTAPGMPEINRLIDSLTQESTMDEPESELAAPEAPLSATTVLDTPVDRLRLADSLFATQEFALALQMYESLDPKQLGNSEKYWVTYQQASCLRRLNETAEAQGIYRQLAGDSNAGWLAGLSRWWLDRIADREELRGEIDQVAKILKAVEEAKSAGTIK